MNWIKHDEFLLFILKHRNTKNGKKQWNFQFKHLDYVIKVKHRWKRLETKTKHFIVITYMTNEKGNKQMLEVIKKIKNSDTGRFM